MNYIVTISKCILQGSEKNCKDLEKIYINLYIQFLISLYYTFVQNYL